MFSGFDSFREGYANVPQRFEDYFRCYPITMMHDSIRKDDANYGGKIFLPASALNRLSMLNVRYPMLFELKSQESGKITHGGVLEFIAEEGRAYLPEWMLGTLNTKPGSIVQICSSDLPLGEFVKIEPQSVDFLDISDPKAVLENVLRNFSTLTVDDIIEISYNNHIYGIKILKVKPESSSKSICVIETDLVTDFAPPVGYVEPDYKSLKKDVPKFNPTVHGLGTMSKRLQYAEKLGQKTKTSFAGQGQKLSGKSVKQSSDALEELNLAFDAEPAKLSLPEGQLFFGFPIIPLKSDGSNSTAEEQTPFQGRGQSLRQSSKRRDTEAHQGSKTKAPKSPEVIELD